jgi:hypothetical protein
MRTLLCPRKNIELGKHIHICATTNQGMRLCLSNMEPVSHVYHTFILFADNTHKEEPTYRVIIASYATRHNLIYIYFQVSLELQQHQRFFSLWLCSLSMDSFLDFQYSVFY